MHGEHERVRPWRSARPRRRIGKRGPRPMLLDGQACRVAEVGVPFAACAASSHGNPVSAVDSRPSGPPTPRLPHEGSHGAVFRTGLSAPLKVQALEFLVPDQLDVRIACNERARVDRVKVAWKVRVYDDGLLEVPPLEY
jgi:hypothetical protein